MWQNMKAMASLMSQNGNSQSGKNDSQVRRDRRKRNKSGGQGSIASALQNLGSSNQQSASSSSSSKKSKWRAWGSSKSSKSSGPEKALKQELEKLLKMKSLPSLLVKAKTKLGVGNVVKEFLPRILELAAKQGGPAQYSEALSLLVQKQMPIDAAMFTKLLVLLTSRVPAPTGMVRLTLNLAIPKDAQAVPLIPEGATEDEERAVFEDGEPLVTDGRASGKGAVEAPPPQMPAKELPAQPATKDAADVQEAREALSKVQPASLRGLVQVSSKEIGAYFGHFTALLHLEFIEELKALKKRLQRDYDNLERFGWAASGLQVKFMNVTKLSKSSKGALPGREGATKKTRLVFIIPSSMQIDRLRMRPGDSVLLSRTDPLKDYHAEGIVDSAPTAAEDGLGVDWEERRKPLVVTVEGELDGKPEQIQEGTWRLDKAANRTAYERQFQALLRFAREKAEKRLPVWNVLPVTGVGGGNVDAWADKMRKMLDEKQKASLEGADEGGASDSGSPQPRASVGGPLAGSVEAFSARKLRSLAEQDPEPSLKWKLNSVRKAVAGENSGLNKSQIEAVSSALGQRCTLIQGPPGTGKTHVSVRLLQTWAQKLHVRPLLATSDSNIAVDNIAEGLQQKGIKVVRVGRPEKVTSNLEDVTLESKLKKKIEEAEAAEAAKEAKDDDSNGEGEANQASDGGKPGKGKGFGKAGKGKKGVKSDGKGAKGSKANDAWSAEDAKRKRVEDYEAKMAILKEAEVICTTTIASGSGFLDTMKFGAILIDEVAQATELSAIVPLILRGAPRFVLVGDHCQLPPSVNSLEAETRGLSLSLFGRLAAQGLEPRFLDTQYRMHPAIADFSCKEFYYGKLKTGVPAADRPPPEGFPWPQDSGIAFINVDGRESRDGESRSNEAETRQLAQVLANILAEKELSVLEVGVVSPYSAQVRMLRQVLRRELPHHLRGKDVDLTGGLEGKRGARALEIASVDAFQGREKELIIFSAVRSNRHGSVGFLADWRRLNVMITRARRGLIVLGNFDTLRNDPTWEKWLSWATESGLVIGGGNPRSNRWESGSSRSSSNWRTERGATGGSTSWSSTSRPATADRLNSSSTSPAGMEISDYASTSSSGNTSWPSRSTGPSSMQSWSWESWESTSGSPSDNTNWSSGGSGASSAESWQASGSTNWDSSTDAAPGAEDGSSAAEYSADTWQEDTWESSGPSGNESDFLGGFGGASPPETGGFGSSTGGGPGNNWGGQTHWSGPGSSSMAQSWTSPAAVVGGATLPSRSWTPAAASQADVGGFFAGASAKAPGVILANAGPYTSPAFGKGFAKGRATPSLPAPSTGFTSATPGMSARHLELFEAAKARIHSLSANR